MENETLMMMGLLAQSPSSSEFISIRPPPAGPCRPVARYLLVYAVLKFAVIRGPIQLITLISIFYCLLFIPIDLTLTLLFTISCSLLIIPAVAANVC